MYIIDPEVFFPLTIRFTTVNRIQLWKYYKIINFSWFIQIWSQWLNILCACCLNVRIMTVCAHTRLPPIMIEYFNITLLIRDNYCMCIEFYNLSQYLLENYNIFIIYMYQGNFSLYFWISSSVYYSMCCYYIYILNFKRIKL